MAESVVMNGLPELEAKLKGLSYDARYKGGRFALRKAAQVIRNRARQNATSLNDPATGRTISQNVSERWNGRLYKSTGNLGFRVGVLQGAVLPRPGDRPNEGAGGPTPHWRLLEFGTEKMAARPFLVPALKQSAQDATNTFIQEFQRAIDRALRKAAKK